MPTWRSQTGHYYVKRRLDGFGQVYRSLKTERKGLARRREQALLNAHRQGHHDVVQAFVDDEVGIARIHSAHESGTLDELSQELRRGDAALGEAADAALDDKSPDVKDSTLERYTTGLDHFRDFCGDDESVREVLTTDVIQAFKSHRLEEDGVAKETVNNDLGAISILATYAERKGWIDGRPAIRKYDSSVRISYLESGEITAYMAELRPAFRPLQQLLLGTGMRLGEAEDLRATDLRLSGDARAEIRQGKTKESVRSVFVPGWVVETLEGLLEETGRSGADPVFDIPRRTVQKEHNRARKRIGRPGYTLHDHRHTAAVHLARAGMPLHLIQRQLGHANIEQTMRYATHHPEYGDVGEYFDRVEESLAGTESAEPERSSAA